MRRRAIKPLNYMPRPGAFPGRSLVCSYSGKLTAHRLKKLRLARRFCATYNCPACRNSAYCQNKQPVTRYVRCRGTTRGHLPRPVRLAASLQSGCSGESEILNAPGLVRESLGRLLPVRPGGLAPAAFSAFCAYRSCAEAPYAQPFSASASKQLTWQYYHISD